MTSVLFCLMSSETPSGSNQGRVEAALPCLGHSQGDACSQAFCNKRTLMFSPGPFPAAVMHWYKSSLLFCLFDLSFQDRKLDFAGVDSVLNTLVLNSYHLVFHLCFKLSFCATGGDASDEQQTSRCLSEETFHFQNKLEKSREKSL